MPRRADIGKRRWLSFAVMAAARYVGVGDSPSVAADDAMHRTLSEAEHGGIGIGRATTRRAVKNWALWRDEVLRTLAINLIDDTQHARYCR